VRAIIPAKHHAGHERMAGIEAIFGTPLSNVALVANLRPIFIKSPLPSPLVAADKCRQDAVAIRRSR